MRILRRVGEQIALKTTEILVTKALQSMTALDSSTRTSTAPELNYLFILFTRPSNEDHDQEEKQGRPFVVVGELFLFLFEDEAESWKDHDKGGVFVFPSRLCSFSKHIIDETIKVS
jgi:hypothetical protein